MDHKEDCSEELEEEEENYEEVGEEEEDYEEVEEDFEENDRELEVILEDSFGEGSAVLKNYNTSRNKKTSSVGSRDRVTGSMFEGMFYDQV